MTTSSELRFWVNGRFQELRGPVDPNLTLAHFLRGRLRLTGTKISCGEGACGSCTVTVSTYEPQEDRVSHRAIKSCLTKVASLHGTAVTTTEGLGSTAAGKKLHPVQERLWKAHGSQCGFCSPGMVMSMSSTLREKKGVVDIEDVHEALQGNLCRCTGYRPIV